MRSRLVLVVAAGLLVGAGEPQGDAGAVRISLVGPEWKLVRGVEGKDKVGHASVTFTDDGMVRIRWDTSEHYADLLRRYVLVADSSRGSLPSERLGLAREAGSFRLHGSRLEVELRHDRMSIIPATGDLHLTLEPAR